MKRSNRKAMARRLIKRFNAGEVSEAQFEVLLPLIRSGNAPRFLAYGYHPTKERKKNDRQKKRRTN